MKWRVLDTGTASAERNMQADTEMLERLEADSDPIIHFYEWEKPSATYGYFGDPSQLINIEAARQHHIELARRPTGGGLTLHTHDFAFSLFIPANHPWYSTNTLTNYRTVNQRVASAIETFLGNGLATQICEENQISGKPSYCLAGPTIYDVTIKGKKAAGAAQRRTRKGILHQGTIVLGLGDPHILRELFGNKTAQAMQTNTYPLTDGECLDKVKQKMKQLLHAVIK